MYQQRYLNGDNTVWNEVRSLSPSGVNKETSEDIDTLLNNLLTKIERNIDVIINKLLSSGYQFRTNDYWMKPMSEDRVFLDRFEKEIGSLPKIFRLWCERIGTIDLAGTFPVFDFTLFHDGKKPLIYSNPLVVVSPAHLYDHDLDRALEEITDGQTAPFYCSIGGDKITNANISGSNRVIELSDSFDAKVIEYTNYYFIDWLSASFSWGDFPGFEKFDKPLPEPIKELKSLMLNI